MQVGFDHEKLDVYHAALGFVTWVDNALRAVQPTIAAKDHLWRASESIVRNIVRANSKRVPSDRAQTFDVSYGSALECAACVDVLQAWETTVGAPQVTEAKALLDRIVAMLIGLRFASSPQIHESRDTYVAQANDEPTCFFAHERLRAYQSALRFIRWSAALIKSEPVGLPRGRELDRHGSSIVLNIAEGNGKFSTTDRRRYLDIAVSSALQAASSLDILAARSAVPLQSTAQGKEHLAEIVSMTAALAHSLQ
jgi:four helix bundle protein